MSDPSKSVGAISWTDQTVSNASEIGEFYEAVAGWTQTPVEMSD